jgi:transcriptional regulator with XRE-family HTH domain
MDDSATVLPHGPVMVARRLQALRLTLGMNRADFADAIGVDRSSYTKIENGNKPLLPHTAYRIYHLYGVDMNYLYLGQVGGVPSRLSSALMMYLNAANL